MHMNKTVAKVILLFVVVVWTWLHYFCIDKVFKDPADLKEAAGVIESQHLIRTTGKSKYEAIILGLRFQSLHFAVHDKHERAFEYLKNNHVVNRRVTVLYDPDGYNEDDNLTYHIFRIKVGDHWLLDIEEAANLERITIYFLLAIDALVLLFLLWNMRQNKKQTRNSQALAH